MLIFILINHTIYYDYAIKCHLKQYLMKKAREACHNWRAAMLNIILRYFSIKLSRASAWAAAISRPGLCSYTFDNTLKDAQSIYTSYVSQPCGYWRSIQSLDDSLSSSWAHFAHAMSFKNYTHKCRLQTNSRAAMPSRCWTALSHSYTAK